MTELTTWFAGLLGLAFILANIAIWSPRKMRTKAGALLVAALFLPAAYLGLSEMLSRPKPIETELLRRQLAEATVLGAQMQEGKAIYLWLAFEGIAEPRSYAMPWSEEAARQLHGAQRTAKTDGTNVQMSMPFQRSLDQRARLFYAAPQTPPPEKQRPPENPLRYQRSQNDTRFTTE